MNMLHIYMCVFALKVILVISNPTNLPGCKSSRGECEDLNILCEFIPLPHILCNEEKINQECPRLCNSCPASTTMDSQYVSQNDTQENTEATSNTVTESG